MTEEKLMETTEQTTAQPEAKTAQPESEAPEAPKAPKAAKAKAPKERKRKHKKKHYLLRLLIILVLVAGAYLVSQLDYFNVNGVAVIGNEGVTDEEIIKLSEIKTGESGFSVLPLLVQHKIKENLYIECVNVNRKPPDKVESIVKERSLLAQFHKDAKYVVTDAEGMVLDITKDAHQATLIEGVTVIGAEKKETIELKEHQALERAMELLNATEEFCRMLLFLRINVKNTSISKLFDFQLWQYQWQ